MSRRDLIDPESLRFTDDHAFMVGRFMTPISRRNPLTIPSGITTRGKRPTEYGGAQPAARGSPPEGLHDPRTVEAGEVRADLHDSRLRDASYSSR
jgi:hypothetical protein